MMTTKTTLRFCHYADEELVDYAGQPLKQLLGDAEAAAKALSAFDGMLGKANKKEKLGAIDLQREELENKLAALSH